MYDRIYIPLTGRGEEEKERERKLIIEFSNQGWVANSIINLTDSSKRLMPIQVMFREVIKG